jgi:hypothetical protein
VAGRGVETGGRLTEANQRILRRLEATSADVWALQNEVSRLNMLWQQALKAHAGCEVRALP